MINLNLCLEYHVNIRFVFHYESIRTLSYNAFVTQLHLRGVETICHGYS